MVDLIHQVARDELVPRFRRLSADEIRDKGAGEIVTVADEVAEAALAEGLQRLLPGSVVIGEEAADRNETSLDGMSNHDHAWLIDPLDGTRHFAAGAEPWGVMVALLRRGEVEAGWIYLPMEDLMLSGRRGAGVFLNERPVVVPRVPPREHMRGPVRTRFLPDGLRASVESAARTLNRTDGDHQCAAKAYLDLVTGKEHFALYYRTSPWDHAPGSFLVQQCGAVAKRLDGSRYVPGDARKGLLVAADADTWTWLQHHLFGEPA